MRPSNTTDAEIVAAGQKLLAEGNQVTGWKLRELLGTGRPERLLQVWTNHRNESGTTITDALPVDIDNRVKATLESVGIELRSLFNLYYQELNSEVAKQVDAGKEALKEERDLRKLEAQEASAELERLESIIERLEAENSKLAERVEVQSTDLVQLQDRISAAELTVTTLKQSSLQLQDEKTALEASVSQQSGTLAANAQEILDLRSFLDQRTTEVEHARRQEQAAREREATNAGQILVLEQERVKDAGVAQVLRRDLQVATSELAATKANLEAALGKKTPK